MSKLVITGGARLQGEVAVEGSKNAVLPILAASLLNGGESIIKNCPGLRDVEVMIGILRKIGCSVKAENDVITINSSDIIETQIPVELAAEMRSSIIFMGPMLARCGKVTISYPGVCVTLWVIRYGDTPLQRVFLNDRGMSRKLKEVFLNGSRNVTQLQ